MPEPQCDPVPPSVFEKLSTYGTYMYQVVDSRRCALAGCFLVDRCKFGSCTNTAVSREVVAKINLDAKDNHSAGLIAVLIAAVPSSFSIRWHCAMLPS